jgi:hypothetical protein
MQIARLVCGPSKGLSSLRDLFRGVEDLPSRFHSARDPARQTDLLELTLRQQAR